MKRTVQRLAAFGTIAVLALGATRDASAAPAPRASERQLQIPAGTLAGALEAVALRFELKILYDPRQVADASSPALSGRMTADQALAALFAGRSLQWERTGEGVVIVLPRGSRPQEPPPEELTPLIVSASRTPQPPSQIASAVSLITRAELRDRQIDGLRQALAQEPGVTVAATGPVGGTTAIYIRGAYPHHTLLVVDGVRMSDRAAAYNTFLGGVGVEDLERIEILRGPQSPLYGGAAIGGVILADTLWVGGERPAARISVSGGSFATAAFNASAAGRRNRLGYSVAVGLLRTDNDLPANGYEGRSYAARLEYAATGVLDVGATFRALNADYQAVGSRELYAPGVASTDTYLGTLYADWRPSDALSSKLRVGLHRREYRWTAPSVESEQVSRRLIVDGQVAWRPAEGLEVVAGANAERALDDFGREQSRDRIVSGFVSTSWNLTDALKLNAGVRRDDYDSVGGAFTWRAGAAWAVDPDTKIRGTYGTGFAAPAASDRYGVAVWRQLPNPDIRHELSKGWDLGVARTLQDGALILSLTYFRNTFRDLIDWRWTDAATETGQSFNRSRASAEGIELGLKVRPRSSWWAQIGYSYLEARDDDSGEPLPRRPRHTADLALWRQVSDRLTLGGGARHVARSYAEAGDYVTVRAFASYALSPELVAEARVENLLDERYDEVPGYPALPRGAYARLSWRF